MAAVPDPDRQDTRGDQEDLQHPGALTLHGPTRKVLLYVLTAVAVQSMPKRLISSLSCPQNDFTPEASFWQLSQRLLYSNHFRFLAL